MSPSSRACRTGFASWGFASGKAGYRSTRLVRRMPEMRSGGAVAVAGRAHRRNAIVAESHVGLRARWQGRSKSATVHSSILSLTASRLAGWVRAGWFRCRWREKAGWASRPRTLAVVAPRRGMVRGRPASRPAVRWDLPSHSLHSRSGISGPFGKQEDSSHDPAWNEIWCH
jgi:hypothetical protein